MSNIETVKSIYEAFGRGDVPAILDKLADDVDWDYDQTTTCRGFSGTEAGRQWENSSWRWDKSR